MRRIHLLLALASVVMTVFPGGAQAFDAAKVWSEAMMPLVIPQSEINVDSLRAEVVPDTTSLEFTRSLAAKGTKPSIYDLPYSVTGRCYDWNRLWINTAVLAGAFVGTLGVLECLPEDATSWNRAELQDVPLGRRWKNHVIEKGPEWDHDKFIFNYVLHPYAGAAYFMSARSCGFNMWQSFLYCTLISNVGWEYGIEAFMERPSYQDLMITPIVGSAIGEGFYHVKRHLVENDYCLWGSRALGNIVAFFVDPVNEVIGLFAGNPARRAATRRASEMRMSLAPMLSPQYKGFSLAIVF